MEIDVPEIVAEVTAAFYAYERAISEYDAATMNALFWDSALTLRYGPNGTLMGHAAIAAFRNARAGAGVKRELRNTVITTFGRDFAVANTESLRDGSINRQSQTWVRMPDGWHIVAAHVSTQPNR